ncbi:hypothetical protein PLICRDRAFT_176825 [Plicaturopsis crispa FD-325 SS-3]|nr:hypothetical protein PLICRDRAFT_176825 [Plicaturopsis crispa FD-325 SS-3]
MSSSLLSVQQNNLMDRCPNASGTTGDGSRFFIPAARKLQSLPSMSLIHFRCLPNSQSALSDVHGKKEHGGLLALVHKAYASATETETVWHMWCDFYLHEWLVSHGVIWLDHENNCDTLQAKMASASQFFFISHELYE